MRAVESNSVRMCAGHLLRLLFMKLKSKFAYFLNDTQNCLNLCLKFLHVANN
jgi:hypothetical protein